MALHKDLTGAELHEPKGADVASADTVYVANGSGSGTWTPRYNGVYTLNQYWLNSKITDISTPSDHAFFHIPVGSEMTELAVILEGPITAADAVVSVYVNGILFADSLTVNNAGSYAGQLHHIDFTTAHTIAGGSVVEVRTDGGSTTAAGATVQLGLRAIG